MRYEVWGVLKAICYVRLARHHLIVSPQWLCNVRKLLWIVPRGGTVDLQFNDGSLHLQFNVLKYFPDSAVMLGRGGAGAGLGSDVTTGRPGLGRGGGRSLTEVSDGGWAVLPSVWWSDSSPAASHGDTQSSPVNILNKKIFRISSHFLDIGVKNVVMLHYYGSWVAAVLLGDYSTLWLPYFLTSMSLQRY